MNSSRRSRSDSNKRRGFLFRLLGSISIGKREIIAGKRGRGGGEESGNACFARGKVSLGCLRKWRGEVKTKLGLTTANNTIEGEL